MITILNTLDIPISARIARQLASGYGDDGGFVELRLAEGDGFLELCDAVCQRVQSEKQAGRANLVLTGTFFSPQTSSTQN